MAAAETCSDITVSCQHQIFIRILIAGLEYSYKFEGWCVFFLSAFFSLFFSSGFCCCCSCCGSSVPPENCCVCSALRDLCFYSQSLPGSSRAQRSSPSGRCLCCCTPLYYLTAPSSKIWGRSLIFQLGKKNCVKCTAIRKGEFPKELPAVLLFIIRQGGFKDLLVIINNNNISILERFCQIKI